MEFLTNTFNEKIYEVSGKMEHAQIEYQEKDFDMGSRTPQQDQYKDEKNVFKGNYLIPSSNTTPMSI